MASLPTSPPEAEPSAGSSANGKPVPAASSAPIAHDSDSSTAGSNSPLLGSEAPSVSSSTAASALRMTNRQSLAVSFDKTVLNMLKLDNYDLDIQEDVLVVVDKEKRRKNRRSSGNTSYRRTIPLYNVLWAEVTASTTTPPQQRLVVDFADRLSKTRLHVAQLVVPVMTGPDRPTPAEVATWAELLLSRAYGPEVPMRRRAYVLVNPHAGPGGAVRKWETEVRPVFAAARMDLTVVTTTHSGQATELCAALDIDHYDMVVPCSGDGLAHEVYNGLGRRPDARRALAQLAVAHVPCGSGNAMACNLYGTHRASLAALAIVKGIVAPLDLVSITQGDRRMLSFLSQAVGVIAEADLATEHLRWMGEARFTWGFLQRFMARRVYPCDLAVKVEIAHKDDVRAHYAQQRQLENNRRKEQQQQARRGGRSKLDSSEATTATTATTATSATTATASTTNTASTSATSTKSENGKLAADDDGLGLPPLQYGTVEDELPEGWEFVPHDKLGNFYCGNMAYMAPDANFFSAALMSDGLVDLVTVDGDIPLHKSLGMITSIDNGHFFDNPVVRYSKITGYRLVPKNQDDGYISIDGERIDFAPFQAEVHRGLGRVIAKRADRYEAPGPRNWEKVTAAERIMA